MEKIDIITVVFRDELCALSLQARSIARNFGSETIGRIIVVINDLQENEVRRAVEDMRHEYGQHAGKLCIVLPKDIITRPKTIAQNIDRWLVKRVFLNKRRSKGWDGHPGWHVQQFLKLLAVRSAVSDFVLILDSKNIAIKPVTMSDFVDGGRARTYWLRPGKKQMDWVFGSYRAIGRRVPAGLSLVTPTVTPVVYGREWLKQAVDFLENRLGLLDCYFIRRKRIATEFMLVFATAEYQLGDSRKIFSDNLEPPLTIFTSTPDSVIDDLLQRARQGHGLFLGVHRRRFNAFSESQLQCLYDIWKNTGIVSDVSEAAEIATELASISNELIKRGDGLAVKYAGS